MLSLLTGIWDTLVAIVQFVINVITSLLTLITHIPAYVAMITTSINVLPTLIIPFALAAVSIYVVLFVIGR